MFKRVRVTFYYNFRSLGALGKPNLILHPKLQFKPDRTNLNFELNGTNFWTHFKWILKLEIEIRNAHSYQTWPKCSFPSKMQKFLAIYTTQYPPLSWMISYWHCNFFLTCSYPTRGVCVVILFCECPQLIG